MEKSQFFATAMNVSTFKANTGFIDRWKRRHSIGMKQISGEEKSVSEESIRPWLDITLPELLLKYTPENIYNVDETALFYKLRPEKTLTFKGEKCSGSKKQKDRLTVLVEAIMASEKLPLLVIGKSKSPRCFAGIRSLPLDYISNAKAWMTGNFFQQ
ncbi:Tigger transposable element-derived protein 6-like [Oopsacas minuta]|uniref:Tigger transposable element-derived protein 6-like n=1 Tax=Oopsacas minuta TaxID=111878 RepID=A0AAV7JRC6_9METZ|nr:Tigger transposable element-derived protein 6-like [Oopsacas minuta]